MSYLGNNPNTAPSIVVSEHIATAGQTTFSASYYEYVQVFLNGMLLSDSDYVANDGSTVVLAVGANVGDVVLINGYEVGLQGPAGEDGDVLAANNLSELTDKAVARTNLNVYSKTEVQTTLPKIGFDTSNTTTPSTGQMAWNQDEKTIDVGINGVVLQMGQELMTMVRNTSGGTITQGTACMVTGTIGASGRLTVSKMDLSTPSNYIKIIGIATEDIANGADGFVTYFGKVRTLNTSMYAEGDMLFLSNTTPGLLTNVVPVTGVKQVVARVINVSATVGTIMVRVTPVDELKVVSDSTKLSLIGGTMTGAITALKETAVAIAASDIDLSLGNVFTKTISGATTFTVSNVATTGTVNSFILELTNAGSATITWFGGVKFAGGVAPTLTTSGVDILGFYTKDGGTTWRGLVLSKDSK